MTDRITRGQVEGRLDSLGGLIGRPLILEKHQPGDATHVWRIGSPGGRYPFGERRRTLREVWNETGVALEAIHLARLREEGQR